MSNAQQSASAAEITRPALKGLRSRPLKRSSGPANIHDAIQNKDAGWTVRRRVSALLRKAFRVVFMGRQRSIGRLSGGGAAVTALLMSMGLMAMPDAAMAQYVAGTGASVTSPNGTAGSTAVGQNAISNNNVVGGNATTGNTAVGTSASATGGNTVAIGDAAKAFAANTGAGAVAIGNLERGFNGRTRQYRIGKG